MILERHLVHTEVTFFNKGWLNLPDQEWAETHILQCQHCRQKVEIEKEMMEQLNKIRLQKRSFFSRLMEFCSNFPSIFRLSTSLDFSRLDTCHGQSSQCLQDFLKTMPEDERQEFEHDYLQKPKPGCIYVGVFNNDGTLRVPGLYNVQMMKTVNDDRSMDITLGFPASESLIGYTVICTAYSLFDAVGFPYQTIGGNEQNGFDTVSFHRDPDQDGWLIMDELEQMRVEVTIYKPGYGEH